MFWALGRVNKSVSSEEKGLLLLFLKAGNKIVYRVMILPLTRMHLKKILIIISSWWVRLWMTCSPFDFPKIPCIECSLFQEKRSWGEKINMWISTSLSIFVCLLKIYYLFWKVEEEIFYLPVHSPWWPALGQAEAKGPGDSFVPSMWTQGSILGPFPTTFPRPSPWFWIISGPVPICECQCLQSSFTG